MMDIKTLVSAMRHCVETCDCVTCPVAEQMMEGENEKQQYNG